MSLQAQFLKNMERMFPRGPPKTAAVALSGGADSMALVSLLKNYGTNVHAFTVDHGLRAESREEAAAVHKLMQNDNIDHHVLYLEDIGQKINRKQIELSARELRYKLMMIACEMYQCKYIFMGHHRDDMLETFLMRLQSSSSMFGLRAMLPLSLYPVESPKVDNLTIARPLLNSCKDEIIEYCKERGVQWFEDPTNSDTTLTRRNYYRKLLADQSGSTPELLQKPAVQESLDGVLKWNDEMDRQIALIDQQLRWEISSETLCFEADFTPSILKRFDTLALSRWLYLRLFQISPSPKFHNHFSRVDNKYSAVVPSPKKSLHSLVEDIVKGEKPEKFTLLDLQFHCTIKGDGFFIRAYRQPETKKQQRGITVEIRDGFSQWVPFDNRIYLKFQGPDGKYTLVNYRPPDHKSAVKNDLGKIRGVKINEALSKLKFIIPILKTEKGRVCSLPTLGINSPEIASQKKLKRSLLQNLS